MNTGKTKTKKASASQKNVPSFAMQGLRQRASNQAWEQLKAEGKLSGSYAAQVQAGNDPEWVGNGLRFETRKAAEAYALDLQFRWTAVRGYRVVESKDAVNNWDWS